MGFPNGIRSRNSFPTRKTAGFKAFKSMEPAVHSSVRTSRNPDFDLGVDFVDTLKDLDSIQILLIVNLLVYLQVLSTFFHL